MPEGRARSKVGCDIGGTFTDFVLADPEGGVRVHKRLTTPEDPSRAVLEGLRHLGRSEGDGAGVTAMIHATTLVVNAVIERKGARTGLITTRGFRDVLELRRHMRTHVFDIYGDPAKPLVPRWHRFEVTERVFADGDVVTPLEADEVAEATRRLVEDGIETVAVVFLHSYANPAHERQARQVIRSLAPELEVSLSSEVLPLIGEWSRTSTTVINAYAKPLVRRYTTRLVDDTRAFGLESFHIMTSDGGLSAVDTANEFPARMIESGPVAGAIAAREIAAAARIDHVLSFDMGGTTAKACLLKDGTVPITSELEVARTHRFRKGSGYPVGVPSVDLIEIGAGGGSIASLNTLGFVQVGPESSGAHPGPACYGRGGRLPTDTDAALVLGYLSAENFLGGQMPLDLEAAQEAIRSEIAEPLGISVEEAAWRIHDVANEMMAAAVRRHLVERGGTDEALTMIAFGGAGPVHAYNLANKVGVSQVLVPVRAGVASAAGLLAAPVAFHVAHALKIPVSQVNGQSLATEFKRLEDEARGHVQRARAGRDVELSYWADLRYRGQGYEVRIDLDGGRLAHLTPQEITAGFYRAYEAKYGYHYDDMECELINLHLWMSAPAESRVVQEWAGSTGSARKGERPVWDHGSGSFTSQPVYDRYGLGPDVRLDGPAIIEENESTTVLGPGGSAVVDASGSLRLTVAGATR